ALEGLAGGGLLGGGQRLGETQPDLALAALEAHDGGGLEAGAAGFDQAGGVDAGQMGDGGVGGADQDLGAAGVLALEPGDGVADLLGGPAAAVVKDVAGGAEDADVEGGAAEGGEVALDLPGGAVGARGGVGGQRRRGRN